MRGTFSKWLGGALLIMLAASPVLAQGASGGTKTGMTMWEMFFLGGDVIGICLIWLILLLSMVNLALSIHLSLKNRRSNLIPFETYTQVEAMLNEKRYREVIEFTATDDCYLSKLVNAGLNEASNGYSAMERAVEETADAETTKLLRPIEALNVLGNVSPMLGLFGTVYGMIVAFQKLAALGGKPDPGELAGGISTALVTTFWGLVVAIPALTAYAVIRNRVDALTSEGIIMAEELIRPFKPGAKKAPPPPTGAGAAARKPGPASPKPATATP